MVTRFLRSNSFTHEQLHEYAEHGRISVYVSRELDEMIGEDLESFNAKLASDITGHDNGLLDVSYEADEVHDGGAIRLKVDAEIGFEGLDECDESCNDEGDE